MSNNDDDDDEEKDVASLMLLGMTMGIVHVLTGPDHLSALATLSANVNNTRCRAAKLGILWGIGHSLGLIIVSVVLISITYADEDLEESDVFTFIMELLVGIFMLALGTYGMWKALKKKRRDRNVSSLKESILDNEMNHDKISIVSDSNTEDVAHEIFREEEEEEENHNRNIVHKLPICIGIVHGVAGPGGVLGVIPTVQLHDAWLASLYLGTFCATSIIVMAIYATAYGSCTSYVSTNNPQNKYNIEIFSASLSLLVGLLWIILVLTGQMDRVFPE